MKSPQKDKESKLNHLSMDELINHIINSDNRDILPEIRSESVDLILTDPPYLLSLRDVYGDWNNGLDFDFLAVQFDRILKSSGQIAIFGDFITSAEIFRAFQDKFKFRFQWIWQKPNATPVNKKLPLAEIEYISIYKKRSAKTGSLTFNYRDILGSGPAYQKATKYQSKTRKATKFYMSESNGERYPRQVLRFPSKCNLVKAERTKHPTQKPIALISYIIRALSNPGELILDPFSGSGSTALAAGRLGRDFIAVENNLVYYTESQERLDWDCNLLNLFSKHHEIATGVRSPGISTILLKKHEKPLGQLKSGMTPKSVYP